MAQITIKDLLEAGCHFGHQTKRWNPRMKKYVFGVRNGISIIDLTKTMHQISDACNFLQKVVIGGGDVLFVGTKRQAQKIIGDIAEETGMFYVSERWLGGTLTNRVTINKSIAKMYDIDKLLESDESHGLKKKELASYTRKVTKLHKNLDGVARMKKLPAAMIVVDVNKDDIAVREAVKLKIPVVGICDTNANPDLVVYPIAANDDAVKSIKVITDVLVSAIMVAKEIHQKQVAEERAAKEAEKAEREAERAEKEAAQKAEKAKKVKKDAPRKEAAPRTEVKKDAPRKDAPRKDAPRKDAPRKEAPKKEAAPKAEVKKEAPKKEAAPKAEVKKEAPKKEAAPKAEAKKEAPKKEAAPKAEAKKEAPKKEAAPKAEAKKEAPKKEAAPKTEAKKEETK